MSMEVFFSRSSRKEEAERTVAGAERAGETPAPGTDEDGARDASAADPGGTYLTHIHVSLTLWRSLSSFHF